MKEREDGTIEGINGTTFLAFLFRASFGGNTACRRSLRHDHLQTGQILLDHALQRPVGAKNWQQFMQKLALLEPEDCRLPSGPLPPM